MVILISIILVVTGYFFLKTSSVITRVGSGNILTTLVKSLPGADTQLDGEEQGRVNIVLLGMRGEGVEGGGLLADTIMVLSIQTNAPEDVQNKASLISIPRDLYVTVPDTTQKQKINAVYALGEEKGRGKGMEYMRRIISEVSGQPIHYAVTIDFKGFTSVVDALGGITIHRDQAFTEGTQFREPHVCDPYTFTVPTDPPQFENKYYTRKDGTKYIAKSYPLCYNKDPECGGAFELKAGDTTLNGEQTLCYARARYSTTDFDRAKRQQEVIQLIKKKMLSAGTLTDFSALNKLLDSMGDNVRTDMEGWEMKRAFDLYKKLGDNVPLKQKVLDTSEGGLLYHPESPIQAGWILLPIGENYTAIHELFARSLE